MLVGGAGTGKTTLMRDKLRNIDADRYMFMNINLNCFTDSMLLQTGQCHACHYVRAHAHLSHAYILLNIYMHIQRHFSTAHVFAYVYIYIHVFSYYEYKRIDPVEVMCICTIDKLAYTLTTMQQWKAYWRRKPGERSGRRAPRGMCTS
jgi:hypothetical protein